MTMTFKELLKGAALGAGTVILFAGLALAQTPAPAPAAPAAPPAVTAPAAPPAAASPREERRAAMHKLRDECRTKTADLKGPERREGMRKCMTEGRPAAMGGTMGSMGKLGRERAKAVRDECRAELKDQRFTEAERRKAMEECAVKKEPALAKPIACRREAEEKKLERGSEPFRSFMRGCITRN